MSFDPIPFLADAVSIPSNDDVSGMRTFLCETLADRGVEPTVEDGNVVAARGSDGSHLVFNTHIDTVSPHVPLERDGDAIRGRGACDAKGPLAAMLGAFLAVDPDGGRATLAVTHDEETHSTGAAALDLDADAYIVGEPTGLDVCAAAKGRFEGTITVAGENAHAAEPHEGTNAVADAGAVLEALGGFDAGADPHPELGAPTLTPTVIRGGSVTNQVPDECRITVDRRSVPPETAAGFSDALNDRLAGLAAEAEFALADRETPFLEPFETPADARIVEALREAGAGSVRPFGAATEASYFAADAPTVVFGPGVLADDEGAVAHADREYVRIGAVERAAAILEGALRSFVG